MKPRLAFVLSGGGGRGALQVGALRALFEAGIFPEMLVGTSIGAANAAFIALHGMSLGSVDRLVEVWHSAAQSDLLPANYFWLTLRALFRWPATDTTSHLRDFLVTNGLRPDLRFEDLTCPLYVVAADLNSGQRVVFGDDPGYSVLEGVLASTALPPWVAPLEREGRWLMDGGAVSNLPLEAAMERGAQQIIALDLSDWRDIPLETQGFGPFLGKLMTTVEMRHTELELALVQSQEVEVRHVLLRAVQPVPLQEFRFSLDLIEQGYEIACRQVQHWQIEYPEPWWKRLARVTQERIRRL